MSRKLFAFLLSELNTVRIICSNPSCRCVTEMPLAMLPGKMVDPKCPVCDVDLNAVSNGENHLVRMASAIRGLQELQKHRKGAADVEFVLPYSTDDESAN